MLAEINRRQREWLGQRLFRFLLVCDISRRKEPNSRSEKQTAANLTDGIIKRLFMTANATNEEAHAKTEKHGGEDGAEDGSLDDLEAVLARLGEEDHKEDNLNDGAQGDLSEDTGDVR